MATRVSRRKAVLPFLSKNFDVAESELDDVYAMGRKLKVAFHSSSTASRVLEACKGKNKSGGV